MIGFHPDKDDASIHLNYVISGAASGSATRFICQPFDVIKIRFQLQIEPISRACLESQYKSLPQSVHKIVTDEGMTALWKGHIAAQMLSIVYGMIQFSSFELYTKLVCNSFLLEDEKDRKLCLKYQPLIHFVCGAMSGFSATLVSHPFDVIRTRLVYQTEPKTYISTTNGFKTIIRTEGYRALFRGLVPTVVQIAPFSGIQFAVYNVCTKMWNKTIGTDSRIIEIDKNKFDLNIVQSLSCGAVSGISAKLVTYPMDLVKKRLQVQGFHHARQRFGAVRTYSGTIDCILKVYKEERFLAFYKGLSPSLLKVGFTAALNFSFYENIVRYLERQKNE